MARKKNLAGLAALAGLAYMASRDKAVKGGAPVVDGPAPVTRKNEASVDTGGDFIEAGSGSNGDFMSEKEPGWDSSTASVSKPTTTRSIATPTRSIATPKANDNLPPTKQDFSGIGDGKGGLGTRITTMKAANGGRRIHPEYPEDARAARKRDAEETARDLIRGQKGYAKGGSVKGWGMARGARKAKTY
jgi:hypothetical protein